MLAGRNLLIIQPPFKAWLNILARKRTTVVIEFKKVVLHESGRLELPPGCHYAAGVPLRRRRGAEDQRQRADGAQHDGGTKVPAEPGAAGACRVLVLFEGNASSHGEGGDGREGQGGSASQPAAPA
mmetsp:Transcript_11478/g.24594  ORF Transcript_11478/g.24594 Transcript_11478/m.24594 type:complete len:126 (-) Transcript_11478:1251-1628(-)